MSHTHTYTYCHTRTQILKLTPFSLYHLVVFIKKQSDLRRAMFTGTFLKCLSMTPVTLSRTHVHTDTHTHTHTLRFYIFMLSFSWWITTKWNFTGCTSGSPYTWRWRELKLNEHIDSTRPSLLCHSLHFTWQIFIHLSRCQFFAWHCGWTLNPNRVLKAMLNMKFICLLLSHTFLSLRTNQCSAGCTAQALWFHYSSDNFPKIPQYYKRQPCNARLN